VPAVRPAGKRTRGQPDAGRDATTRMFATCTPGLAALLADELGTIAGITVRDTGFDGRVDVVLFDADRAAQRSALTVRLAEDVFAEIGRTLRSEGDRAAWISGRILRPERIRRALDARAAMTYPVAKRATYRVVVRVLQERSFLRTDLRREFARTLGQQQPDWRPADPAQVEVWVAEYLPGRLVAGVRLSDARMRQHDGRAEERTGALRPTVAAAMVMRAGTADGLLLDPCCGSGTILAEARSAGWTVRGTDIDAAAVATARHNVPGADVERGDARRTELSDGSVSAVVSNLPFGQQYTVDEGMTAWLRTVLAEAVRVTVPGGRLVLLAPAMPRSAVPATLSLVERHQLRLLGTRTTLWVYARR
jgi:23S rRNA G2445 N2-methylase RlmL